MFEEPDDLEPLATALEGNTIVAPAPESRGMPAWIQGLLLITLVAGVGAAGWILWSQSSSIDIGSDDAGKGPITGTVNGLEPEEGEERLAAEPAAEPKPEAAEPEPKRDIAPKDESRTKRAEAEPGPSEGHADEPETARAEPARATPEPDRPSVPTQGLPRDPARASDVLVHRSLRLIRDGKLAQAQATLDRAWELDPKNPQAMAGYARLFLAKKNGDVAVKWARKAVRKRPKRAPYHVLYGDALALQGKTKEARAAYRRALSVDPKNRAARSRLSEMSARAAK